MTKIKDNEEYFKNWYLRLSLGDPRLGFKKTQQENTFIKKVLSLTTKSKILDLGCGHGRHSLNLAKNYNVTGLDFDPKSLTMLKHACKKNKVNIRIIQGDMRKIPYIHEFDAVIMMFSTFGYFIDDNENLEVLKSINRSIKKNGKLLFDIKNKKLIQKNSLVNTWSKQNENYILYDLDFEEKKDLVHMNLTVINEKKHTIDKTGFILKIYEIPTIKEMLHKSGFHVIKLFGDYNGTPFNQKKSNRAIILAEKNRSV